MKKARYISCDGQMEIVLPSNGCTFGLDELREFVDGNIEIIHLGDNLLMVVNEEGKLLGLPFNFSATCWFQYYCGASDFICGDVLICPTECIL